MGKEEITWGVEPYDSSRITRGPCERANVRSADKIDRAAMDDSVRDLHFEGGHYATLRSTGANENT